MSAFLHSWLADFQPGGFQKVGLVTPCEPSDFGLRFRTPHSKFRIGNARRKAPSFLSVSGGREMKKVALTIPRSAPVVPFAC